MMDHGFLHLLSQIITPDTQQPRDKQSPGRVISAQGSCCVFQQCITAPPTIPLWVAMRHRVPPARNWNLLGKLCDWKAPEHQHGEGGGNTLSQFSTTTTSCSYFSPPSPVPRAENDQNEVVPSASAVRRESQSTARAWSLVLFFPWVNKRRQEVSEGPGQTLTNVAWLPMAARIRPVLMLAKGGKKQQHFK